MCLLYLDSLETVHLSIVVCACSNTFVLQFWKLRHAGVEGRPAWGEAAMHPRHNPLKKASTRITIHMCDIEFWFRSDSNAHTNTYIIINRLNCDWLAAYSVVFVCACVCLTRVAACFHGCSSLCIHICARWPVRPQTVFLFVRERFRLICLDNDFTDFGSRGPSYEHCSSKSRI